MELNATRKRKKAPNDDSEDAILWDKTVLVEPFATDAGALHGRFVTALAIDFPRFTDGEIAAAFSRSVAENRPENLQRPQRVFPGPRRKGRKSIAHRVALERLGLMRLLHWHTPQELRDEMPVAWRTIARKERSFRREIRGASKFFRRLFPFLPKGERPSSEDRNGIWSPPIQRMLDQMDAERAKAGT